MVKTAQNGAETVLRPAASFQAAATVGGADTEEQTFAAETGPAVAAAGLDLTGEGAQVGTKPSIPVARRVAARTASGVPGSVVPRPSAAATPRQEAVPYAGRASVVPTETAAAGAVLPPDEASPLGA